MIPFTLRPWAEFDVDLPDDTVWDAAETRVLQTGGKALTEIIAELLGRCGCTIEAIEDELEHCWICRFSYQDHVFQCLVWALDTCALHVRPIAFTADPGAWGVVLTGLDAQMRADGRFQRLVWFDRDEGTGERRPFDAPVAGELPPPGRPGWLTRLMNRRGR